jgi:hypothetical protein
VQTDSTATVSIFVLPLVSRDHCREAHRIRAE